MIIQSLKKQTHTIFLRDLYSSSKLTTVTKKPELLLSTKRGNRVVNLLCCLQWVQINSEYIPTRFLVKVVKSSEYL